MIGPDAVEIHRRLPAPVDEVFQWWTDPERLREWMSPVGTVEAEVDLRVGGTIRIVMRGDGMEIEHLGTYLKIEPPHRLVFTWTSPYTGPHPSIVTLELEPDGVGATRLHLVHQQLPEAATASHRGGWGAMLDRLGDRLQIAADVAHGR
jgi:glutathione S-transferase